MKLKCLASGSSGNCYLLEGETETLILDAGIPIKNIKRGLNWNIKKVVGAVVTHSHLDHAKSVKDFENMGICVCTPYNKGVFFEGEHEERIHEKCGRFDVSAFALTDMNGHFKHTNADGSECPCYGFLIQHSEMGKLLYITDTELVKWRFRNINHILLGVNYSSDLITESAKRKHVLQGHMNIDTACEFIRHNNSNSLRNVVLCHLSDENSDENIFKKRVEAVTEAKCFIANKGLEISLNLIPF